jgi:hypothetical protein
MMKYKAAMLLMVFALAGCTDSVETVTRELRATTNEAIDALAMVTTEAQAARMTTRVFKPMSKRYEDIDRKLTIVKSNRTKDDMCKEVLESDGMQIYLTDLQVNRQRYALEMTRLRSVYKQILDKEKEARGGEVKPQEVCPNLHDMLYKNDTLESLRKQLTTPDLLAMMIQFPQQKLKEYDAMYLKFLERRATFAPQREIKLVW